MSSQNSPLQEALNLLSPDSAEYQALIAYQALGDLAAVELKARQALARLNRQR